MESGTGASGVQLFQVIRVAPKQVYYEARTADGNLYDAFTLTETENGTSSIFDHLPDANEMRE